MCYQVFCRPYAGHPTTGYQMLEANMSDSISSDGGDRQTRERSPSFPYIGLGRAVERTRTLHNSAKRFSVRVEDAAKDWGLGTKSSATLQTVATLLAYGLIESKSTPEGRKIKVSEDGWRILEDRREGVKERLLARAALNPEPFAEYALAWKINEGNRPNDDHAISQLKFEGGYSDEAARRFLRVFDEAVGYARTGGFFPARKVDKDRDISPEMPENNDANNGHKEVVIQMQPNVTSAPDRGARSLPIPSGDGGDMKIMLDGDLIRVSAVVDLRGAKKLLKALRMNIELLEDDDDEDIE